MLPVVGRSRPFSSLVSVVFPAPFSPTSAVAPAFSSRVKAGGPNTRTSPGYVNVTCSSRSSGIKGPHGSLEGYGPWRGKTGAGGEPRIDRGADLLLHGGLIEHLG